ncbi:stAR-related lipid transfer protein 7, mitochondrial-like [Babylonia areolata]|uniref:stAR-related lipid transfer protein 7, mitochondrial-like n=1 Tax=Babylonia areolata TaxID=304850 RepID=UPI003FD3C5D7
MRMANEGIFTAFRFAWTRHYSHKSHISSTIREKLINLAFGTSGRHKAKQLAENVSTEVQKACSQFAKQCNVIAGQRTWRAFQIFSWYQQLYGEQRLLQTLKANLLRHCRNKNKQLGALLAAAGIFQWERDGITDEELHKALSDMDAMEHLVEHAIKAHKHTPVPDGWEMVIDRQHLKVWRRFMTEYKLYEYRVYGSFSDISPRAFYNTQMDLKFWSGWDQQTMEINVVDVDVKSNSSVIHWVYKFPYPMYPRDYLYVRRSKVEEEEHKMVIVAKAVSHPKCPETDKVVRIARYQSQMVIEPHSTIDQNGFSYYMNYFDDPQTQLPSLCYSWLASTGVPDFVERLHAAAKVMQERTLRGYQPNIQVSSQSPEHEKQTQEVPNMQQYC